MKKIITVQLLILLSFSCKNPPIDDIKGNWSWSWVSDESKYCEALIDSSSILIYRHGFLHPREYKIENDSFYLDKIENGYDLKFKIELVNKDEILLTNKGYPFKVEMIKLSKNNFVIDSIKNDIDKERYELEYTTRKEKWLSSKKKE